MADKNTHHDVILIVGAVGKLAQGVSGGSPGSTVDSESLDSTSLIESNLIVAIGKELVPGEGVI